LGLDSYPLLDVIIDTTGAGDHIIVAGIPGRTIRVFALFIVLDADTLLTVKDGPAIALTGAMSMLAHGTIVFDIDGEHWFITSVGNDFILNTSSASGLKGRLYYTQTMQLPVGSTEQLV